MTEELREYYRARYWANVERMREYQRKWREAHKDAINPKQREAARKYRREHRDVYNAKSREYWQKPENRARKNANARAWRKANREKVAEYKRRRMEKHPEALKAERTRAEKRRKLRKQIDAAYYHKRLVLNRMNHARATVLAGKMYHPRFHLRTPEWAAMGEAMDVRSPWLAANMTPEQNAYARELAIERMAAR